MTGHRLWLRLSLLALALALLLALPARAEDEGKPTAPKATAAAPIFLKVPPINIPVIRGNKIVSQIDIGLMVELAEGHSIDELEPKKRQLLDAYISDLYPILQLHNQGDALDAQRIKDGLHRATIRILGPDLVKDVLIEQLFEQPR